MSRIVKCGLIQTSLAADVDEPHRDDPRRADRAHARLHRPGRRSEGVQILCMQEIFTGPYFCAEQNTALVRRGREDPRRPDREADAGVREEAQHGHRRADLRRGVDRRLLQHRRRDRRRRQVPRQVPQEPHPARRAGLLGEVLLPPRQPRLSGVRHGVRARSASTSATTATSPKARARSG